MTENQLENLKLLLMVVEQSKINFKSSLATMTFQKRICNWRKPFTIKPKEFEAGTGSNTEITAAQTDLITAQTNYITALYSAIIAKIDYLKATGKL